MGGVVCPKLMNAPEEHMGAKVPVVTTSTCLAASTGSLAFDNLDHLFGGNHHDFSGFYFLVDLLNRFLNFEFFHINGFILDVFEGLKHEFPLKIKQAEFTLPWL